MSNADATIDLSNVDLSMIKYFKYPAPRSQQNQITQDASAIVKAKAMITYAADVLFGNSYESPEIPIDFDPQFGHRWRQRYERQFGRRGVNLVVLLGQGYSKEELSYYGAMSNDWWIQIWYLFLNLIEFTL